METKQYATEQLMCHWKKSRTKSKNTWRQRKMIMQKFKINGIQQKQVKREFYTSLPNETKINVSQPGKGHIEPSVQFSSVQSLSHVWSFVTPWTTARQASLSITNSRSLLKLMSIASVMPSNHLILCHPLLLLLAGTVPSWLLTKTGPALYPIRVSSQI